MMKSHPNQQQQKEQQPFSLFLQSGETSNKSESEVQNNDIDNILIPLGSTSTLTSDNTQNDSSSLTLSSTFDSKSNVEDSEIAKNTATKTATTVAAAVSTPSKSSNRKKNGLESSQNNNNLQRHHRRVFSKKNLPFSTPSKLFDKENKSNHQQQQQQQQQINVNSKTKSKQQRSEKKRKFNTQNNKNSNRINNNNSDSTITITNNNIINITNKDSHNSTPPRRSSNVGVIMSSIKKKGGKLIRTLTPPRHLNVGIQTPQRRRQAHHTTANDLSVPSSSNRNHGNGSHYDSTSIGSSSLFSTNGNGNAPKQKLTLSSQFHDSNQYTMRTSETDPSPFQIDIPSHESILAHCKICCIMENYFDIGGFDFDFSSLMPWAGKHSNNIANGTKALDLLSGINDGHDHLSHTNSTTIDQSKKTVHTNTSNKDDDDKIKVNKVLATLHEIVDDIVVEGFFRDYYVDDNRESGLGRVEVCVFSSNKLRRFIICYRCSSDVQDRPLQGVQYKGKVTSKKTTSSTKDINKGSEKLKDNSKEKTGIDNNNKNSNDAEAKNQKHEKHLHTDVNGQFLKAYDNSSIQENIITLLNRLTSLKPFCDVVMTGHSFGGSLATLASQAYASNRPDTRVYCHVFGSPIVGGKIFRDGVHSLPNLNLIRIERSTDPFVNLPESHSYDSSNNDKSGSNYTDWIHAGHCLRLTPTSSFALPDESKKPVDIQLYRFDKHRPSSNFMKAGLLSVNNLKKLKIGNEIKSYEKDLEKIISLKLAWVDSYYGEVTGNVRINGVFA